MDDKVARNVSISVWWMYFFFVYYILRILTVKRFTSGKNAPIYYPSNTDFSYNLG